MITVGHSKRSKEYHISKLDVYNYLMSNYRRKLEREYIRSGDKQPLFKWLSDELEESFYDLDLDKEQIVIDLGFIKVKSKMSIQQIR